MKFFRKLLHVFQTPLIQQLLLVALVCICYLPTLPYAFLSDDIPSIVERMPTMSWRAVWDTSYAFHLSSVLQFILYTLIGLIPWPYRLVNILFHIGSVIVLYRIVSRLLNRRMAFWASAIFAVHPLIIESVTWISGGVYAIYGFWFLLSFLLFIRGNRILSVLSFCVSLGFSEKAIVLPLIYAAYLSAYGILQKRWKTIIPYGCAAGAMGVFYITKLFHRTSAILSSSGTGTSMFFNPLEQLPIALTTYLQLFIWPDGLTLYHSDLTQTVLSYSIRVGMMVAFGMGCWLLLRKKKSMIIWIAFIVVPLLPTLLPIKIAWVVAERYAYLSVVGLSVVFVMVCDTLCSGKYLTKILPIVFSILVVCLMARTIIRARDWQTQDALWIATVKVSPTSPLAWNNMGDVFSRHGDLTHAADAFGQAIRLHPQYADAYHNLGETYRDLGRLDDAVRMYKQALVYNPGLWQSYMGIAGVYARQKKYTEAGVALLKAEELNPGNPIILENKTRLHMVLQQ